MQKTAAGVDVRASGPKTESDSTVSRGASDVHWGVWIQALTLLGPREVVRTAANMPSSMQHWRAFRAVRRSRLLAGRCRCRLHEAAQEELIDVTQSIQRPRPSAGILFERGESAPPTLDSTTPSYRGAQRAEHRVTEGRPLGRGAADVVLTAPCK
jgi:hypothetical protein